LETTSGTVRSAAFVAAMMAMAVAAGAQSRAADTVRTPWGDPDLQGLWTNQTLTPLERPAEFAGKTHLTEAEAREYEARLRRENDTDIRTPGTERDVALGYNDAWWDRGDRILPDRRTSLIVDPPDGKVPPLTPAGEARLAAERAGARREQEGAASWQDFDVSSRCIIRRPLPRLPGSYNNNYQIVQTPGYVAILQEEVHETRIIPLGGPPHLPASMRQWLGDSRGRWEGDTLVVETTNFTDEARGSIFRAASRNMILVERFRRVDARALEYEFTVTDPETWVRPWTARFPWHTPDGMLYEYACHEGNYGLANTLRAARLADKNKTK
jgi:hypothetical protein